VAFHDALDFTAEYDNPPYAEAVAIRLSRI